MPRQTHRSRSGVSLRWKWVAGVGIVLVIVTLAASARGATQTKKRRVSVWWDIGGPLTVRHLDRHIANLKTLGVSGVSIMLTKKASGGSDWTGQELATFASALRGNRIGFGFDTWVRPTPTFVGTLPELSALAHTLGTQFIEFDAEDNWTEAQVKGYASLDDAGAHVAQAMAGSPVPWGVTTFRERLATTAFSLARYGSFIVPQAYSRVGNDDRIGAFPGDYQVKVYDQTRKLYGKMPVVMGLAAFDQSFPGMDPAEAMLVAARTSFDLADEVRFWSWKWIGGATGTPRNQYAFEALARLRSIAGG